VPQPKGAQASPQDAQITAQIVQPTAHIVKPTQDLTELIKQFLIQKKSDPFSAGNLLTQISQYNDLPFWFTLDEERDELQAELDKVKLKQQAEELKASLQKEYDALEIVVEHQERTKARRIIRQWLDKNPIFGDPKNYLRRLLPSSLELLPAPFGWVKIPAGKVRLIPDNADKQKSYLKQNTTFDIPTFEIGKYPVTNAQYAPFIEAGGYKQKKWWTEAGWAKRETDGWTEPRHWKDAKWNGTNHPVVGVSWYEAIAYCHWLSEASGEKIMLPTEQQWQRAAQAKPDGGDTGWVYVWGNEWQTGKSNTKEAEIGQTTPVTAYENKGNVSPCGVVDLIGNVWTWCLTAYGTGSTDVNGTDSRVLRGGSWYFNINLARAVYRSSLNPDLRSYYYGFWLCRPPSL